MTSILLVSESAIAELGFESLAANDDSLTFLGRTDPREADERMAALNPDILVVDFAMEATRVMRLCEHFSQLRPNLPILIVSGVLDGNAVRACIDAGARGYLYKNADRSSLRSAISWLADGYAYLDPVITRHVIDWAARSSVDPASDSLSARELEVLRLASRGESNKRIARRMGLTENTVKTYLRRAYRKLDCRSRTAAAAALVQRGLL
jgi:DNA-binding NarL/FixJ family response regulator